VHAVIVPDAAGVLSALGLVLADERRDNVRSYLCALEDAGELPSEGEAELRYRGQSHELRVPLEPNLAAAFHRAHAERYGYADPERTIELVAVHEAEVRRGPAVSFPASDPAVLEGPAVVELAGSTIWLPPGWVGVRDGPAWTLTRNDESVKRA
jgi:N-methylhydantoinase A